MSPPIPNIYNINAHSHEHNAYEAELGLHPVASGVPSLTRARLLGYTILHASSNVGLKNISNESKHSLGISPVAIHRHNDCLFISECGRCNDYAHRRTDARSGMRELRLGARPPTRQTSRERYMWLVTCWKTTDSSMRWGRNERIDKVSSCETICEWQVL